MNPHFAKVSRGKQELRIKDREIRWLIDEKYNGDDKAPGVIRDMERLEAGEHIAYVIGWVDFLGVRVDLSKRPLIPRPETEYWVGEALKTLPGNKPLDVLDIFAGSGCIGTAVLKKLPKTRVDFAEAAEECIKEIKINLERNAMPPERVRVIQSDVFSNVKGIYDVIFANPPYGAFSRRHLVSESVLKNEPHFAIFGGDDGLLYIKKLLSETSQFLKPGGVLWLEFDAPEKEDVERLAKDCGFGKAVFFRDQYGEWRYCSLSA